MDKDPAEVLRVFLDSVIQLLDLLLLQESEHPLLELPRAFARDDLNDGGFLRHGLVDDRVQGPVDVLTTVVDVVQVELQLHGAVSDPGLVQRYAARAPRGSMPPRAVAGMMGARRRSRQWGRQRRQRTPRAGRAAGRRATRGLAPPAG